MAEQHHYRVGSSAASARLLRVKCLAMLSLAGAFIAVNWVTTQHAAGVLGDAPWLGEPLFHLPEFGPLYAPWSWVRWWIHFHAASALAPLWTLCAKETLYPTALIATVACAAIAIARQGWLPNHSDLHGSARWAVGADVLAAGLVERRPLLPPRIRRAIEGLGLLRPIRNRAGIYLAKWRRWYLRDCGNTHVLVFAPSQTGKGSGIVIPTLLKWPHSVLVHDVKIENWNLTAAARKRMGQVCLKFEPASAEPGLARFNPLAEVRLRTPYEIGDVQNIVKILIDPQGFGPPDHWERAGSEAFEAFILHTLYEGREPTLAGVADLLFDPERTVNETMEHLMRAEHDPTGAMGWKDRRGNPTRTHRFIAGGMRGLLDIAEKERSSIISEVKGFLGIYRDPVVAANTAVSDFRIEDLVNYRRPISLFIAVSLAHQKRMRPLFRLMLTQILNRLTERLNFVDGRAVPAGKRPLLLMMDEFATLGRLDMFAESLSLIAGYGIKACLITQDMKQIYKAYGHDETITSNCDTRVAYRPNSLETAQLLSNVIGQTTVRHEHRTVSGPHATVSQPELGRPLLAPDEAMRLGDSEALIFTGGLPPIRATKLRHFRETLLRALVKLRAPVASDRIERAAESNVRTAPPPAPQIENGRAPAQQISEATKPTSMNPTPRAGEQLSFLKFAVERGNHAERANEKDAKERLL
jgi:type IV secretion system protein VirD4